MDPDGCIAGEVIYFGKAQQVTVDGGADQRTTVAMSDRYVSLLRWSDRFRVFSGGGVSRCQDQWWWETEQQATMCSWVKKTELNSLELSISAAPSNQPQWLSEDPSISVKKNSD